jgi:hypothetical protein
VSSKPANPRRRAKGPLRPGAELSYVPGPSDIPRCRHHRRLRGGKEGQRRWRIVGGANRATAPVSHQKRPHQNATNAIETAVKPTKLIDILPLITVWLQVERFPNRQLNQLCFGSNHCPHRCEVHQAFGMPIGPRTARRFTGARQPRGKGGAIRPICAPQLPSSHTCALDFFLAGEAYDLIASDRWWFGAEAWAARTKRLGSRH